MFEDSNVYLYPDGNKPYEPKISVPVKSITDGLTFALNKVYLTEPAYINKYVNKYVSNKGQKRLKDLYEEYEDTCEELGLVNIGGLKQIYYIALLITEQYEIALLEEVKARNASK
jgi:hypothetical protein